MAELRIGMIGLDTSHVSAFSKLLNDPKAEFRVPGGRVVVAFPGGSPDFELSHSRVGKFTDELKTQWGVKIVDSPEAVAEQADLVLIESVDGRVHRKQFEQIARFKKPTFIDKPITTSLGDAEAIFKLAKQNGIAVMSSSSLRYAQNLLDAMPNGRSDIITVDAFGPVAEEAVMPGLYWYGIHTVEMIMATMGPGCVEVQAFRNAENDVIRLGWSDGRQAIMRGMRTGHHKFGITLHRKESVTFVDASGNKKPYYAGLLEAIFRSLPNGKSDVPMEETLEIVRIIDAVNQSRQSGAVVKLGK